MKMEKTKHNHNLTDCLKIGIYAMIMLAPVTAILSTTSYMAFNKNAELPQQETTKVVEHKPQTNEVNSEEDLIEGNWYSWQPTIENDLVVTQLIVLDSQNYKIVDYQISGNHGGFFNCWILPNDLSTGYILNVDSDEDSAIPFEYDPVNCKLLIKYVESYIYVELKGCSEEELTLIPSTYETQQVVVQENANAFYYACNQVIEQPLFNWTQSTGTYQVFESVTNGLGMQDQTLPTILTYMFLVTIIYLIIDIIIEVIKLITHMITSDK